MGTSMMYLTNEEINILYEDIISLNDKREEEIDTTSLRIDEKYNLLIKEKHNKIKELQGKCQHDIFEKGFARLKDTFPYGEHCIKCGYSRARR